MKVPPPQTRTAYCHSERSEESLGRSGERFLVVLRTPRNDSKGFLLRGPVRMRRMCEGVDYTIVNGEVLIERGEHTGALPGRVIRSSAYRG